MKTTNMFRIIGVLLVLSVIVFGSFADAEEATMTPYEQLLDKLSGLKPGETMDVIVGTQEPQYSFGTPVDIRFHTTHACYPVLMGILAVKDPANPSQYLPGEIIFFLPSYYSLNTDTIQKEQIYSIIDDFHIPLVSDAPAGFETINFFCSTQKIDLFEAELSEENPVYTIEPGDHEQLQHLFARLDLLAASEWSGDSVQIEIGPRTRGNPPGFGIVPPIGTTGTTGKNILFPPIGTTGTTGHSDD